MCKICTALRHKATANATEQQSPFNRHNSQGSRQEKGSTGQKALGCTKHLRLTQRHKAHYDDQHDYGSRHCIANGGEGGDCRGVSVCVVVECGSCWQARPVTLAKRKANGPISAANLAIIHRFSQHFILF